MQRPCIPCKSAWLILLLGANGVWAAAAPTTAPPDGWAMFRGTLEMTGQAGSQLPDKLELLWSFDSKDSFEATCAIADGVVYVPTMDGRCYALRLSDGKEVWKFVNKDQDGAKSSPCIAGDLVCYGDDFGIFRALDRKSGKLRWKLATDAEIISSPSYINGKVLFGSYDGFLYCVDPKTGKVVWKSETDGPVHCSPSLAGGTVAVAGCDGVLRLIAIADGKQTKALEIGGNIASTPAVVGNRLFLGTMGCQVLGVNTDTMERVWEYEYSRRQFPYYGSAAVSGNLVIIGGRDKMVHALDRASGQERWSLQTKGRIEGSPVVVGERVFVGSSDGTLYGIDLASGKKVWSFVTGAPVVASPAVAAGRLVIGDQDGKLYCFGAKP